MKKTLKIIAIILSALIFIFLILFITVGINSAGKLHPLTDEKGNDIEGALSEKTELMIGGIPQKFFIRSENPSNPVILYLHGGPGSPELPLIIPYETPERLEKYFTVCYWDQRGAGMSYSDDIDTTTLTVAQYVEDTRELTEYLMERFGKDKIYLMGHSWGSFLGVKTIQKYPLYYHAYVGIGQVTNQHYSEQLAYWYMLDHARAIGDKKTIKQLEKFDPESKGFPQHDYLMGPRTNLMNKYGIGIMHQDFSMNNLLKDVFLFNGYTLSEKAGYGMGSLLSLEHVFDYVIDDNLFLSSNSFDVPVYIIHGAYDYQVSHELAKQYYEVIQAPHKAFFSFENSAHSPNMEDPERFVQIVKEIAQQSENAGSTGVQIKVSPAVYSGAPESITYSVINNTDSTINFGERYVIDRWHCGAWLEMPYINNMAFNDIQYYLLPGHSSDFHVYLYGDDIDYPEGLYRLRKIFDNGERLEVAGEFTIR